jgi:hypothetical protein
VNFADDMERGRLVVKLNYDDDDACRTCLGVVEKRKIPFYCRESNPEYFLTEVRYLMYCLRVKLLLARPLEEALKRIATKTNCNHQTNAGSLCSRS